MKSVLLPVLMLLPQVVMAEAACENVSKLHYVDGWKDVESVQRIDQALTPGGVVSCSYYPDREQRLNVLVIQENGVFDGVEYELQYADASAVVQGQAEKTIADSGYGENWRLGCREQTASGKVQCRLTKSALVIEQTGEGLAVVIGADYRDSSTVLARVAGQKAVTAAAAEGYTDPQSRQLVGQMKVGEVVDLQFHHIDRQKPTDVTVSLFGLKQAIEIMDRVASILNAAAPDAR